MKLSIPLALLFAILITLVRPVPAAAAFTVCNHSTAGSVNFALAANWIDSNANFTGESKGWYVIPQGACKVLINRDISPFDIYIYAYSTSKPSDHIWGGENEYCMVLKTKFLYQGDAMNTPCSSGVPFGMRHIDTFNQSDYTFNLQD